MTKPTWNPKAPLERAKGESRKANQALRDYALMGSGRSQRKLIEHYKKQAASNPLAKPPTLVYSTLAGWCLNFDWVARVDAWTEIRQEQDEIEWAERRRQIRQDDYRLAERLRGLANEILDAAPTFYRRRVKTERGEPTRRVVESGDREVHHITRVDTQIVTVALDGNLMTKAAKVASELGRLAAEVQPPAQKIEHSGEVIIQRVAGFDDV
jgi:hypothetical protein